MFEHFLAFGGFVGPEWPEFRRNPLVVRQDFVQRTTRSHSVSVVGVRSTELRRYISLCESISCRHWTCSTGGNAVGMLGPDEDGGALGLLDLNEIEYGMIMTTAQESLYVVNVREISYLDMI